MSAGSKTVSWQFGYRRYDLFSAFLVPFLFGLCYFSYQKNPMLLLGPSLFFLAAFGLVTIRNFCGHCFYLHNRFIYSILFLQVTAVVITSCELNSLAPLLYLTVPLYFTVTFTSRQNESDWFYPKIIFWGATAEVVFASLKNGELFWPWTILAIMAPFFMMSRARSLMSHGESEIVTNRKQADRFLFHDIVNQTHGIKLFLNHKLEGKRSLPEDAVAMLIAEIESIEKILYHHYGYTHKNLKKGDDILTFDRCWTIVWPIIQSYLSSDVKLVITHTGRIGQSADYRDRVRCLVHLPSFSRIMINLFKNITEASSKEVEIKFSYDLDGLHIELVNSIVDKRLLKEPSESLKKIILSRPDEHLGERDIKELEGLGLLSIAKIAQDLGGEFQFYIDEKRVSWVSKLYLPNPDSGSSDRKIAA